MLPAENALISSKCFEMLLTVPIAPVELRKGSLTSVRAIILGRPLEAATLGKKTPVGIEVVAYDRTDPV
jgi:hypothetical protein